MTPDRELKTVFNSQAKIIQKIITFNNDELTYPLLHHGLLHPEPEHLPAHDDQAGGYGPGGDFCSSVVS